MERTLTTECEERCEIMCVVGRSGNVDCMSFTGRNLNIYVPRTNNVSISRIGKMRLPELIKIVSILPSNEAVVNNSLTMEEYAFQDAKSVQTFIIKKMMMEDIPRYALPDSLRELIIKEVPLGKLPSVLRGLNNLTEFYVVLQYGNEMNVDRSMIKCELQMANMPGNLKQLKILKLSGNNMELFNASLPRLEELQLLVNRFHTIPRGIFTNPNLKSVDMRGNLIRTATWKQIMPYATQKEADFIGNMSVGINIGRMSTSVCCGPRGEAFYPHRGIIVECMDSYLLDPCSTSTLESNTDKYVLLLGKFAAAVACSWSSQWFYKYLKQKLGTNSTA